jgi:histidinol-phosphate aminotransferase
MIKTRNAVKTMKEYDPPTKLRAGKLRLDFNENSTGCSPKVIEKMRQITAEDLSIYPAYGELLDKICEYMDVPVSQVLATNGTDEALKCFFDTFINEKDEVIILSPSFAMFGVYADAAGADVKELLYNEDLSFPVDNLLNAISSKTRMIMFANPNNPTGTSISNDDLRKVLEKSKEFDCLVVADEAYFEFYEKSALSLIGDFDNLAITRTFSKSFGMAAVRLGFIVAKDEIIREMRKVLSPYSVNGFASTLGVVALSDIDYTKKFVAEVNKGKEILYKEFTEIGIKFFKGDANFFIANFGEDCDKIYDELKKRDILVRNRTKYPRLKNCLRIGVGSLEQTEIFLNAFKEIYTDIKGDDNE